MKKKIPFFKKNKDPLDYFEMYIFFKKWISNCSDFDKKYLISMISPLAISILIDLSKKKHTVVARIFFVTFYLDLNKKMLSLIKLQNNLLPNHKIVCKLKLFYAIIPDVTFVSLINFFEKHFHIYFLKYVKKYFHITTLLNYNFTNEKKISKKPRQVCSKYMCLKKHNIIQEENSNLNEIYKKNLKFFKILKISCENLNSINSVFSSQNDDKIIIGFGNSSIKVIELNNFKADQWLVGHSASIVRAKLSDCNNFTVSCAINGELNLWSNRYKKLLIKYENFNQTIWDVCISAKKNFICAACGNSLATLWDFKRMLPLRFFVGHKSDVNVSKWHPRDLILATGSDDQTLRLWDTRVAKSVTCYKKFYNQIYNLEFSPDGFEICVSGLTTYIDIWDIRTEKVQKRIKNRIFHKGIKLAAYSPDGLFLILGLNSKFFKLFYRKLFKSCDLKVPMIKNTKKINPFRLKFEEIYQIKFNSAKTVAFIGV